MIGRLIELFSKAPEAYVPVPESLHDAVVGAATDSYAVVSWLEIEQSFTGLLLGVNSRVDEPMSKLEKSALASIYENYLTGTMPENLVPRLPAVIPKVMLALQDKDTDAATLANILSTDLVLVSEVIRLANSPYYARSHHYDSLEQAIVNIGFNGVRQMIVSASLKPILSQNSGRFAVISSGYLWDKSMQAGLINDCVANTLGVERFHAYLAGLTMQSGMTLLIRGLDQYFDDTEAPSSAQFIDTLNRYGYEVSARISQQWQFPEPVTQALQQQFSCNDPEAMSKLGQLSYLSDKLAKARILKANGYLEAFNDALPVPLQGKLHEVYTRCLHKLDSD